MNLKTLFTLLNGLNLLAIFVVIVVIAKYQSAYSQMEQTYISKNRSFLLADELRQSSDDLTRLARTYVITANPRFKEQYYEVLAIRNGTHPRPVNYNRIYWDFLAVDNKSEHSSSQIQTIALHALMEKEGFVKQELDLLSKSQSQSDALVHIEEVAMHAVEGYYEDENGSYTIRGKPNLQLAREIMHSDAYHQSKIKIMSPLNQFFKLFEDRTNLAIKDAKEYLNEVEYLLIATVVIFVLLMIISIVIMLKRIVHPLVALKKSMLNLANNDLVTPIPSPKYNDEVGQMSGAVNVFKENTIKLVLSERRIKLLLDAVGEGIFGLDENGRFTFVNPAGCEFLDATSDELIGMHLAEIIYEKTLSSHMQNFLINEQHIQTRGEVELRNKSKTSFLAEYVSTPIIGKNDNLVGSVVVFSDITERKKTEEAIRIAKNNAEAANRAKSLFLANMSHELRTPLNAILGFARLLLKHDDLQKVQKENLGIIYNSGKHLLNIISEILEVAKLDAGKIEIVNQPFNLHSFLENIIFIFSSRAEEKGLNFYIDDIELLPKYIISDEQRLRQVFFNILSNAIKFTYHGSITVHIEYINNNLKCSIVDTGLGISEEDIKRIFRPFEQIKLSHEDNEGTGLGLTITKELITLMGGQINVTSQIGYGTQFNFNLYIQPSIGYEEISNNHSVNKYILLNENDKKPMALIVDDIYENRSLLVQTVKCLGFNTCEAENGIIALEQLGIHNPDIILMDIQMPHMDGFETIERIRFGMLKSDIPIVLISANVFEGEQEKAIERGANAFIGKPIRETELISTIENLLNITFISEIELTNTLPCVKPLFIKISEQDVKQLQKAAKELDANRLNTLLLDYETSDPVMVKYMRNCIHNYQFEEIVTFLDEIENKLIKK